MAKFVIIVGGVISGIGKGVVAASTALLLKSRSCAVQYIKFDPYYCVNAGLLSPNEHGEVFLLDDGQECDLDLGHIERISSLSLTKHNICTSGTLFKELIEEQERGEHLGKTITNNPFVIDKIIARLEFLAKSSEVVISEIGGTVDDTESSVFLQAIFKLKQKYRNDCLIVLVSPILWVDTIKEFKTKPLQRSVRDLQSHGLHPDVLIARSGQELPEDVLQKTSDITGVPRDHILKGLDCSTIYSVPLQLYAQDYDDLLAGQLGLKRNYCKIRKYKELIENYTNNNFQKVNIGVVTKYNKADEAYISLKEALTHAGINNNVHATAKWISAEDIEKGDAKVFADLHGLIVPGGFDSRGVEGKVKAIKFARENKLPFLGICLGLQCAVIEHARNVCKLDDANSLEFNKKTPHPVVHFVEGQEKLVHKSANMRLGAYDCEISKGSLAYELYGKRMISERHRHRYEINGTYVEQLERNGLIVTGKNPESGLVEIMELRRELHPYFIGTQAHPEFRSQITNPAPLFNGLVQAAMKKLSK